MWIAGLLGMALLVYTIRQGNLSHLAHNFYHINKFWAATVLGCSALSYLCIAAVLQQLLKGIRHPLRFLSVLRIAVVSCTLNYLMALAGVSGIAAKVYLLAQEDIPPSQTLSVSMVHGFLTNTVAVVLIYFGFFSFYTHRSLGVQQIGLAMLVLPATLLLTWITIQTIISAAFRTRLWGLGLRAATGLCRWIHRPHWIDRNKADAFFAHFDDSMKLLIGNSRMLWSSAGFALLDWLFMFLCLACSFLAARYPVDVETLLVGFSVAIFVALFSITPGGIGLIEGSMVGSFYLMGLDYDQALLAVLIYRFAYYVLPLAISFFFFKKLFSPAIGEDAGMQTLDNQ